MQSPIPPPFPVGIPPSSLLFIIGTAQALMLAAALWNKVNPTSIQQCVYSPNRFLALLVAVFAVLLLEHSFETTGYFYHFPYLIDLLEPFNFLIAPLLYFYVLSITSPKPLAYQHRQLWHLIPFLLASILYIPVILTDSTGKMVLFYAEYYLEGIDVKVQVLIRGFWDSCVIFDLDQFQSGLTHRFNSLVGVGAIYFLAYKLDWLLLAALLWIYLGLCFYRLKQHRSILPHIVSSTKKIDLNWLQRVLYLVVAAVAAFTLQIIIVLILNGDVDEREYSEYLSRVVIVVLVLYMGFRALKQPQIFSPELASSIEALKLGSSDSENSTSTYLSSEDQEDSQPAKDNVKYRNSPIPPGLSNSLAEQVRQYVQTHKSYLNSELTLPQLAEQLELSTHVLSQLLNETAFFKLPVALLVKKPSSIHSFPVCPGLTSLHPQAPSS